MQAQPIMKSLPSFLDISSLIERASSKFEHFKKVPTTLRTWINLLPKGAELHLHLLGAIYPADLLKIAIRNKLMFDPSSCLFSKSETNWWGRNQLVSAEELMTNSEYLTKYENAISMRNVRHSTNNPHDHFMYKCFSVIESIIANSKPDEVLHLITIVKRNARRQHIRYIELMVGLQALQQFSETILLSASSDNPKVNFIIEISRLQPDNLFLSQLIQSIDLIKKYPMIRAFNIVGPEDNPNSQNNFERQMEMIHHFYAIQPIPVVLHAGELTSQYATPLSMCDRIKKSILEGHAMRIGHGVCLDASTDPHSVITLMKTNRIAIEICLASNDKILGVQGKEHPIHTYVNEGVKVVIASDDPGVNLEDLNDQFNRLVYQHAFDLKHLIEFTRNSLEYSLLPGESIFEDGDVNRFTKVFIGCDQPDWIPSPKALAIMKHSQKAEEQVGHERNLATYLMKLADAKP